ncbi:hypothetical protein GE09DRAFT_1136345, partial [Coniochaeta sp. 2T2.1]
MAHAHNVMIRQLNSMYLQAPYVKEEADQHDLCQYAVFWKDFLHHHHDLEETVYFPDIERITGVKGIMEENVSQHAEFTPGLDEFGRYVQDCLDKKQTFDSRKFTGLIDAFGPKLATHLAEEVGTLVELGKYDIQAVKKSYNALEAEAQKVSKTKVLPLVCGARDVTYEGGCTWPRFPFFVPYMIDWMFTGEYKSVWRFNPSTIHGKPRPLHFLPKDA